MSKLKLKHADNFSVTLTNFSINEHLFGGSYVVSCLLQNKWNYSCFNSGLQKRLKLQTVSCSSYERVPKMNY
jgi:hypothetical protein